MMTYSLRNKTIALATAIIFALSLVMMPVGTAFAGDMVEFIGGYRYVEPGDDVAAGFVMVSEEGNPAPADKLYFKITLPSGVEFASPPAVGGVYVECEGEIERAKAAADKMTAKKVIEPVGVDVYVADSTPTMLKVFAKVAGVKVDAESGWSENDQIRFDFGDKSHNDVRLNNHLLLNIDDDFRGDLRVNVEVHGFDGEGNRVWVESETITIARVGEKEAIATAEDPEAVSVGQNREAAKITIKELLPGTLERGYVALEMRTEGVRFDPDNVTRVKAAYLGIDEVILITHEERVFELRDGEAVEVEDRDRADRIIKDIEERIDEEWVGIVNELWVIDVERDWLVIEIDEETQNFAGRIEITPILDIDPDVTGGVRIRVSGCNKNEDRLDETTLTVATVGDVRVKIDDVKYNDGIIYAGVNEEELDTEFKVRTIGGEVNFKRGDMITFELSAGKLVADPVADPNVSPDDVDVARYDECEEYEGHYGAFYVVVEGDEVDEIEISGLKIKLDPDVEPGDLKLRVGGDYGDLGEVVIARIEEPFTATAEEATEVMRDSAMKRVADIVITEANDGVLDEDVTWNILLELPEGIIFSKKPEVEVTRGDLEIGDPFRIEDDEVLVIPIDDGSTEKSTITISEIYYTVKPWAALGDVEVRITEELDGDVFTTVVNAKVVDDRVDERTVTATFAKGDDGVEIKEGRTMLRVNVLCDIIGLHKSWDPVNRTAYFVRARDGRVVAFPIGRNEIILNGMRVPVDQGAVIINDFTHVPIRHIQKAFGGELHWDDATKTATYVFEVR
ncbi:copper amine oxidase N-terminal domain-containing protein [Peptococcaceae bacterium]|nr:copper amine oxidase N-terminal domain-containing protein [Peptococcaceae bacterium]